MFRGAARPILEPVRHAFYYHGKDGFGGSVLLPQQCFCWLRPIFIFLLSPLGSISFSSSAPDPPMQCVQETHAAVALLELCKRHCQPPTAANMEVAQRRARLKAASAALQQELALAAEVLCMCMGKKKKKKTR